MKRSPLWLAAALACGALFGLGCSKGDDSAGTPANAPAPARAASKAPASGKKKLFVMVPKGVHKYYDTCYDGFKAAAAKYGVDVEMQAPLKFEVPAQVQTIENLIARHVDGIAISANDDEGLVPVIADATKAGIKVITFDAPAPSSAALTYIGTANEQAGRAGAEALIKYLGGQGEVAVLQGGMTATNLNLRFGGFKDTLAGKAPGIKIVARENTDAKADVTVNKTEALLEAHPNLKAIFGVSAEGCPNAASVIKEQGKSGRVLLAGFDDMPDTIAAIKAGTVKFCIAQRTYKMGWLSVEKLLDACAGKKLEKQIDTGVIIVDASNVDTYMQEMKKELK